MSTTPTNAAANAAETVDPARIPTQTLYTGATIPAIGLGTFGSDRYTPDQVADAVRGAARAGYRHFDCASVYGNEREVGAALADVQKSGVRREDLWVTSKLWNDKHDEADVIPACRQSLADLGLDYLDLYLVHWPFPNYHAPGVDVSARDPHARPYIHENFMKTWRQMERLADDGLARHIGVSNMTIPKLTRLLEDARIKPAASEMELHPHFQQTDLFQFTRENGILPIGYSPLGSPSRPIRDRTPDDTVDMDDPVVARIAARLGITPADVCIKWAVTRGQVPIPFSVKPSQYIASLRAASGEPLGESDMTALSQIDRNNRLIKGHVFLWKDDQTWEALWDLDGEITPP